VTLRAATCLNVHAGKGVNGSHSASGERGEVGGDYRATELAALRGTTIGGDASMGKDSVLYY